jgi:hypothetical protein
MSYAYEREPLATGLFFGPKSLSIRLVANTTPHLGLRSLESRTLDPRPSFREAVCT